MSAGTFHYKGRKYHHVATIEDGGEIIHVVKFYGKYHQYWHYEVMYDIIYQIRIKDEKAR